MFDFVIALCCVFASVAFGLIELIEPRAYVCVLCLFLVVQQYLNPMCSLTNLAMSSGGDFGAYAGFPEHSAHT